MNNELIEIRSKKIGVLIKQMRENRGITEQDCADWLGISLGDYQAMEKGGKCASLPQIESLSRYLSFPLEAFASMSASVLPQNNLPKNVNLDLLAVREKKIAILLKQELEKKGLTLQELAAESTISLDELTGYFRNSEPIPFSQLLSILSALQIPLDQLFIHESSPAQQSDTPVAGNDALPAHLSDTIVDFISKPANLPYLELAMRFSKMDAEKIRSIASSLLEITY
jgi:transcriptional regulator with XRE-family HTH domain